MTAPKPQFLAIGDEAFATWATHVVGDDALVATAATPGDALTSATAQRWVAVLLHMQDVDEWDANATAELYGATTAPVVVVRHGPLDEATLAEVTTGAVDAIDATLGIQAAAERLAVVAAREHASADTAELGLAAYRLLRPLEATARAFGELSLAEASKEVFDDAVESYRKALHLSLEERGKGTDLGAAGLLRSLAQEICSMRAGPSDVFAVHVEALRRTRQEGGDERTIASLLEESRFTLVGVMGSLTGLYRTLAAGRPRDEGRTAEA